jgi:hypothetical protein
MVRCCKTVKPDGEEERSINTDARFIIIQMCTLIIYRWVRVCVHTSQFPIACARGNHLW